MQNNIRTYANSLVPKNYTNYLTYLNSPEYIDVLILFDVCLKTLFLNNFHQSLKFFILNNKFGTLASTLLTYKFDFLLISPHIHDYYTTPDEFKFKFKQIDWKNNILKLNFNPSCVFDLYTFFNSEEEIKSFITFLNNNSCPIYCGLIYFNQNVLNMNTIFDYFIKNNYLYNENYVNQILSKLKNKLNTLSINNLFIFSHINKDL